MKCCVGCWWRLATAQRSLIPNCGASINVWFSGEAETWPRWPWLVTWPCVCTGRCARRARLRRRFARPVARSSAWWTEVHRESDWAPLHEAGRSKREPWLGKSPHRIDGWWNRSTAGFQEASLGREGPKNPPRDEASFYELRFVRARWWACRARAVVSPKVA